MSCLSRRIIDGQSLTCAKAKGHSGSKHRAILDDLTVIEWEGAPSAMIEEATEDG